MVLENVRGKKNERNTKAKREATQQPDKRHYYYQKKLEISHNPFSRLSYPYDLSIVPTM